MGHNASSINPLQFYRLPQLRQRLGVSASSIWAWVKSGKFPKPVKLSDNVTAWRATDIEVWVDARIAASRNGEIDRRPRNRPQHTR